MKDKETFQSYAAFKDAPLKSTKHTSYFATYDSIFWPFFGKDIVFCEVGVLGGGSLFMWRKLFGPNSRIIGIDLNPQALEYEKHGFEIFIGNQSSADFWDEFFNRVGKIDILLDDGAHNNLSMATTLFSAIDKIKEGGLMVFEDTHTSYIPSFGNPSRNSFVNLSFRLVDRLNMRSAMIKHKRSEALCMNISNISFYESIVVFAITTDPEMETRVIANDAEGSSFKDFKLSGLSEQKSLSRLENLSAKIKNASNRWKLFGSTANFLYSRLAKYLYRFLLRRENKKVNNLISNSFNKIPNSQDQ